LNVKIFWLRVVLILLPLHSLGCAHADTPHNQLPEFPHVVAYFERNVAVLNGIYEQYLADERINWVECGNEGSYRITSHSAGGDLELDSGPHAFFQHTCQALDIWLIQRVDSGVSVHWKDLGTDERRFRVELYRTGKQYVDSCRDQDFSRQISSCMVPLDSDWAVRYFWLPHNET